MGAGVRGEECHLAAGVPAAEERDRVERSFKRVGAGHRDLQASLGGQPHEVCAHPVPVGRAVGQVTA